MPDRNSVPMDFFGPYREELLQRYGLDRRQISSRELPLSLANSPTRRSFDVGDFDDPVLPLQRRAPCCSCSRLVNQQFHRVVVGQPIFRNDRLVLDYLLIVCAMGCIMALAHHTKVIILTG